MSTRIIEVGGPIKIAAVVIAGVAFAAPHLLVAAFYGWMFMRAEATRMLSVLGLGG